MKKRHHKNENARTTSDKKHIHPDDKMAEGKRAFFSLYNDKRTSFSTILVVHRELDPFKRQTPHSLGVPPRDVAA
jgi:hypothetical protein